MIGNISKGSGFRGVLDYALEKQGAQLIGGNMLGHSAPELAAEFKLSRQLNPKIEQPVFHVSLSLPHNERPTPSQWNKLASDYLQQMGFTNNQYVVVEHSDRQHSHIHIIAAKGTLDGQCVPTWNDYHNSQRVIRQLEQKYSLQAVANSWEVERKGPTKGQQEQQRREQAAGKKLTPNVKGRIQDVADASLKDCKTPEEFIERMRSAGVQIQTSTRRDGSISGISYKCYQIGPEGAIAVATSGTKVGAGYTWKGIGNRISRNLQEKRNKTREMWQRYSKGADTLGQITRRALRDEQHHGEILEMIKLSRTYQDSLKQNGSSEIQELAQQLLSDSIQQLRQESVDFSRSVSLLLNQLGAGKRQRDGSLVFEGNNLSYWQHQNTISVLANDGRGEIFRVEEGTVLMDKRTDTDLDTCHALEQKIKEKVQALDKRAQLSIERERDQDRGRGMSL